MTELKAALQRLHYNLSAAPHEAEKCFVSLDDHRTIIRALSPSPDRLREIATRLLNCWDNFKASDANQAEAYYRLAKNPWNDWEELRAALATPNAQPMDDTPPTEEQ